MACINIDSSVCSAHSFLRGLPTVHLTLWYNTICGRYARLWIGFPASSPYPLVLAATDSAFFLLFSSSAAQLRDIFYFSLGCFIHRDWFSRGAIRIYGGFANVASFLFLMCAMNKIGLALWLLKCKCGWLMERCSCFCRMLPVDFLDRHCHSFFWFVDFEISV